MFIKYLRLSSLIVIGGLVAGHCAHALPFTNADGFVAGDGKAIYETNTGLTWLDFGITHNKSFNQVCAELDSTYHGWRLPTENEVKNLWNSTIKNGSKPPSSDYHHEYIEYSSVPFYYQDVFDLWGANVVEKNELKPDNLFKEFFYFSTGMVLSEKGELKAISIWEDSSYLNYLQPNENWIHDIFAGAIEAYALDPDAISIYASTLLVKDPVKVPEPTPVSLLLGGLLFLSLKRLLKTA